MNKIKMVLWIASWSICFMSCEDKSKIWNINDYGALGDGTTVNTEFIQETIDECNKAGGGTVLIPQGDYVSGTILLKNNVTLHISKNARLLGSQNPTDYQSIDGFVDATGQERGKCLIGAMDVQNVSLIGEGMVDGRGEAFQYEALKKRLTEQGLNKEEIKKLGSNRPFLVRFVRTSGIVMKNVHLRQPAAWTCHFYQCSNILVDSVDIYSHAHQNNDGIDLDSSHDAIIRNCSIDTGDDAICFKTTSPIATYDIKVSDCNLKSDWGAIKFGTESMGDFYNIDVRRCKIADTKGGGLKILSVDGANISNIRIDSIEMNNVDMPIFMRLGERLRTYRNAPKQEVGTIDSVYVSNINATTRAIEASRVKPPSGVFLTGTPNHKLGYLKFENINISLPGGGTDEDGSREVEEMETSYPEFSFFEVLPAYGLMARHVQSLNLNTCEFSVTTEDARDSVLFFDVQSMNAKH